MRRRSLAAVLAAASLTLGLAACGSSDDSEATSTDTLTVGVSPVPHGEILKYVSENLAGKEGLKLEIKEFNDYIQPNVALSEKQLDANYFQHIPYLEEEVAAKAADEPIIAELARRFDVDVRILGGSVETLATTRAGRWRLALPGRADDNRAALEYLRERGVTR